MTKLKPTECLTRTSNEFVCFVAGEIIQVIEATPGSVVPLAMFVGQVMSPKLFGQMLQRSPVSGVALCMLNVKVP